MPLEVPNGAHHQRWSVLLAAMMTTATSLSGAQILVNDGSFGVRTNRFGFSVSATPGQIVVVEGSTNLSNWLPLQTNTLGSGPWYICDPATSAFPWRFYRARARP